MTTEVWICLTVHLFFVGFCLGQAKAGAIRGIEMSWGSILIVTILFAPLLVAIGTINNAFKRRPPPAMRPTVRNSATYDSKSRTFAH